MCVCVCERDQVCAKACQTFSLPSQLPSCVDTTGPCWIIVFFIVLAQNLIVGSYIEPRSTGIQMGNFSFEGIL